MLNLTPPDSAIQKPTEGFIRNTASFGSISDGAGHVDYPNNTNRTWMIATPDAKSYIFNFGRLNTEKLQDIITIYNGPTEASGVAYTFSGHYKFDELPEPVTITADSVLVKFTSDGSNTDKGFVLYYTATFKSSPTCSSSLPSSLTTWKYPRFARKSVSCTVSSWKSALVNRSSVARTIVKRLSKSLAKPTEPRTPTCS